MAAKRKNKWKAKTKTWVNYLQGIFIILAVAALAITVQTFKLVELSGVPTWPEVATRVKALYYKQTSSGTKIVAGEEEAVVHIIDVGQGNSTLIVGEDYSLLIDAGERTEAETVINYLSDVGVEKIDYMVATHPHADHIGGLAAVLEEFEVDTVLMPKIPKSIAPDSKTYQDFLQAVEDEQCEMDWAVMGNCYELSEWASFTLLGPSGEFDDLNNMSAGVRFQHGETAFNVMADMEAPAEENLLAIGMDLSAEVLVLGHHGSDTSNTQELLDAVHATYYVAQVGYDNKYDHPSQEVVDRVRAFDGTFFRSDVDGDVVFVSDGVEVKAYSGGMPYDVEQSDTTQQQEKAA